MGAELRRSIGREPRCDSSPTQIDTERGWFYHFVNLRTGAREWASELSSIDTALLLAGVLTVRQCFAVTRTSRARRRDLSARGFRVDAAGDPLLLSHGWKPRQAFSGPLGSLLRADDPVPLGDWLARPTPFRAESWRAWPRPVITFDRYSYVGGPPPLFVHQYAHAWIDFRGCREQEPPHTDWWRELDRGDARAKAFCWGSGTSFPDTPETSGA